MTPHERLFLITAEAIERHLGMPVPEEVAVNIAVDIVAGIARIQDEGWTHIDCPQCKVVIYDGRYITDDDANELLRIHRTSC
ncbi:hypothetical protein [Rhodococcus sp. Chr-9]|uniref:hypothetical protein n=1 Tax=Rhodococcus sp. Chr-9 TaxID=713612 RepID=UPI00126A149F|nr:hypothetical protein [Rhodococcus sp. Chr-9]